MSSDEVTGKVYPLEEAVRAQRALRDVAGMGPEMFPIQAFVGMISDEIEELRNGGHSDDQIAEIIRNNSKIAITAGEIASFYASGERRHGPPE